MKVKNINYKWKSHTDHEFIHFREFVTLVYGDVNLLGENVSPNKSTGKKLFNSKRRED